MSKDEYMPVPDVIFPDSDEAFDWTIPIHPVDGGQTFLVLPEMATAMSDDVLQESLVTLQVEASYRYLAATTTPLDGYHIVREGVSQEGDLKLCHEHGWEPADEGSAYWSFNLLIRPEKS